MSQITAIYAAIAGITISGVTARGLTALPEKLDSAQLPTRLIMPQGGRGSGNAQRFRTFKTPAGPGVLEIDWTITDLLLYRAASAGIGLIDVSETLVGYCGAYLAAIGPLRTATWSVTSVQFPIIGALEWPAGSERWYDGVQVVLTVREIV